MRKLSRSARALLTIAGFLVLIGVAALILVPPLSSARVESEIREKLESRGLSVASLHAKLRADGRLLVSELCVNDVPPFEAERLACVTELSVDVGILDALRGRPQIRAISAESIEIWMPESRGSIPESSERLTELLSGDANEPESEDESESDSAGLLSDLQSVKIATITVHLDGHPGVSGPQRIESIDSDVEDGKLTLSFDVLPSVNFEGLTESEFTLAQFESLHVEAALNVDDAQLVALEVTPSAPFQLDFDRAGHTVRAELSGVEFEAPYSISIVAPSLVIENAVDFQAKSVMIEPGSRSTDLNNVFVANLVLDEPIVELQSIASLKSLVSDLLAPGIDAAGDGQEEEAAADIDNGEGATLQQRIIAELEKRKWWEVLPQRLEIGDGTFRLASTETRPSIEWTRSNLVYAMRYIGFQMDIEASSELYVGAQKTGDIGLDGFWKYQESSLNADLSIDQLPIGPLTEALSKRDDVELGGVVSSELNISGGLKEGFSFLLAGDFEEPYAELPIFDGRYAFGNVGFKLPGSLEKTDEGWNFALRVEELVVDTAHFSGGITASGLGVDGLIARRLEFHVEVPDQPVAKLFTAIPEPILGPLVGAEMSGDFGLTLKFPVLLSRDDDNTLSVQIEDPTEYDFRDEDLALVELPEEVDVRKLNQGMTFIFRGPDDAIMRRLRVPSPSLMRNYRGISETDETPMNWSRLWDISFYVIAAQLYREDGSFFRNTGINWYQLRRVTAEAVEARKLGRGASTISMQLVKNLFLSHERSVERKFQELFLTYWMTRIVPKERILEVYLNVIEWGPNLNGIREAAEFYFEKDPATLSAMEGTWLSSITPNPVDLGGNRPRSAMTAATCGRCRALVEGLSRRGWISRMETDIALETPRAPLMPTRDFDFQNGIGTGNTGFEPRDNSTTGPNGGLSPRVPFDDAEVVEAPSDFQLMSPKERLREWVNGSRSLRGDGR